MSSTIQDYNYTFTAEPVGNLFLLTCKNKDDDSEVKFELNVVPTSCTYNRDKGLVYSHKNKVYKGDIQFTFPSENINLMWYGEYLYATVEEKSPRTLALFRIDEERTAGIMEIQTEEKYVFDYEGLVLGDKLLPLIDSRRFARYGLPNRGKLVYVTETDDREIYLFYANEEFIMYEIGDCAEFPTQIVSSTFRTRYRETKSKNSMDLVNRNILLLI